MRTLFFNFYSYLSQKRKKNLLILGVLIAINSFLEILCIAVFVDFISLITISQNANQNKIIDRALGVIGYHDVSIGFKYIVFLFIFINILSYAFRIAMIYYQTKISHFVGSDFSTGIFSNSLSQPYLFHVEKNSSNILSGITVKSEAIIYYFILPILSFFSSIPLLVAILSALFFVNAAATALAIAIISLSYLSIVYFTQNILKKNGKIINEESNKIIKIVQEGLGGIRDIIIDGTQKVYCDIFRLSDIRFRASSIKVEVVGVLPRYVIEAVGLLLIALYALLMHDSHGTNERLMTLAALAFGAQRMLPLFQQIYQSFSRIRAGEDRLLEAIELRGRVEESQLTTNALDSVESNELSFNVAIELKNLSFSYKSKSNLILDNLNLKIPKGSRIGFVGSSGGGKSTLLDVIMGLLPPSSGKVLIDDVPLDDKNIYSWRSHIAHVPQSIFLKDASVLENIAFGVPLQDIDIEKVRDVARRAGISKEIESWPMGYATKVGERGIQLSGGQRQRIGIARALFKNASVMVLDEATSALDEKIEREVMNSLYSIDEEVTFLIVAHRISTLDGCDIILELNDGKIAEKL